jgi:hypothetical protein
MDKPPRRPWFQFGLRSLLLGISLIGVWLGWNARPVYRRAQILARIRSDHFYHAGGGIHALSWENRLPAVWRLLGARPQPSIAIRREDYTREEIAEIEAMFPEANIFVRPAAVKLSAPP